MHKYIVYMYQWEMMYIIKKIFSKLTPLLFFFTSIESVYASENDVILNGFNQFINIIYNYKCEKINGGLSYNTQYIYSK